MSNRRLKILLVDDSPADCQLVQEMIAQCAERVELVVCHSGEEALSLLRDCHSPECPDLLLLDLNLPGMNGFDVLKKLRSHDRTRATPVTVMTTSTNERDIHRAYGMGANCYVSKPLGLDRLCGLLKALQTFWGDTAHLPPRPGMRPA